MNKKNIAVIAVILLVTSFFLLNKKPIDLKNLGFGVTPTPTVVAKYPDNWSEVDSEALVKLEKTITSGLKPEIILIKSEKPSEDSVKVYTDKIIAGAKSAIRSLVYETDKSTEVNGYSLRQLTGYYYNKNNKVKIIQNLYLKDNNLYTLTASYQDDSQESEINTIFDRIVSEYLPN